MVTPPLPPTPPGGQDQYTEFLARCADWRRGAPRYRVRCVRTKWSPAIRGSVTSSWSQCLARTTGNSNRPLSSMTSYSTMHPSCGRFEAGGRNMRLITSAVEDRAAKRLKAKDEEMKSIWVRNQALQDQLRVLQMEAQAWYNIGRSKEAAANVLRGDLRRALAQVVPGRGIDDANSCCWGDNRVAFHGDNENEVWKPEVAGSITRCKGCGQGKAMELLLPCRHLCMCVMCAATARVCPVCGCAKTAHLRQLVPMCGNSSRVDNFLFHLMIFLESTVLFVSFHVFLSRLDGDGRAMVE
ncbi:hypothetical protein QYE76_022062 [Lolium multiflorum]|uniref:RING-type domain-containing protein n=1 Tax=Lolium multiflorum TaxID=4521 RepID=A0AAD8R7Z1_LOLMU|nr:hypothetical protein QYE76_022062 [Lolium multiflorum]